MRIVAIISLVFSFSACSDSKPHVDEVKSVVVARDAGSADAGSNPTCVFIVCGTSQRFNDKTCLCDDPDMSEPTPTP